MHGTNSPSNVFDNSSGLSGGAGMSSSICKIRVLIIEGNKNCLKITYLYDNHILKSM